MTSRPRKWLGAPLLAVALVPVGDAWQRAMQLGVADTCPYIDIETAKIDLRTF